MVDTSYSNYLNNSPGNAYGLNTNAMGGEIPLSLNRCQYWVKGMPALCTYWDTASQKCKFGDESPSGYNRGLCDYLGRNPICDKYKCDDIWADKDKYICIVPCPSRTGLMNKILTDSPPYSDTGTRTAIPIADIQGYNPDKNNVGQCDTQGKGTGAAGVNNPQAPTICLYFRPWYLGFGSVQPDDLYDVITFLNSPTEYFAQAAIYGTQFVLPLSLKIRNFMARLQKCAYWNKDYGSAFVNDYWTITLEDSATVSDLSTLCTNTNTNCKDYATQASHNFPYGLDHIWSNKQCIVCNGAKAECPGYTGKWLYCIDSKLTSGSRFSVEQLMELRFWFKDWISQKEYDEYFALRPNNYNIDAATSKVYTFDSWVIQKDPPNDSLLKGKEVSMCMPPPYFNKSFDPSTYITSTDIVFTPYGGASDKGSIGSSHYPTLIRDLDLATIPKLLKIYYPYPLNDPWTMQPCYNRDYKPYIKCSSNTEGDAICIVAKTVKNTNYYIINTQASIDSSKTINPVAIPQYLNDMKSVGDIPVDEQPQFYIDLAKYITFFDKYAPNYIVKGMSDSTGYIFSNPLQLIYQKNNILVIAVKYSDGTWEFNKVTVWSQFIAGMLIQNSFQMLGDSTSNVAYVGTPEVNLEGSIRKVEGKVVPISGGNSYGITSKCSSLLNTHYHSIEDLMQTKLVYSYCVKTKTMVNVVVDRWVQIEGTKRILIELNTNNVNYVFDWNITKATMTSTNANNSSNITFTMEYPTLGTGTYKRNMHPDGAILITTSDSGHFNSTTNTLTITYTYKYISNDIIQDDSTKISWPSFSSLSSNSDSTSQIIFYNSFTPILSADTFSIDNIGRDTLCITGIFSDQNGRPYSSFATNLIVCIPQVICRNVEIDYSYSASGKQYQLMPSEGFNDHIAPNKLIGSISHSSHPPCGDHDLGMFTQRGPMWYPFSGCTRIGYYNEYQPADYCNLPVEGNPNITYKFNAGNLSSYYRLDYRLQAPVKYTTFVSERLGWMQDCSADWVYYYNEVMSPIFTGKAYIRAGQLTTYLQSMRWDLPPFGQDVTREYIHRYLSEEHLFYLSHRGGEVKSKSKWMPIVPDNRHLSITLNSLDTPFENQILTPNSQLCFWLFNQCTDIPTTALPTGSFNDIDGTNESIITNQRAPFDNFISVANTGNCSYPSPLQYSKDTGSSLRTFYYLWKDIITAWVWQESWKDIQRNAIVSNSPITLVKNIYTMMNNLLFLLLSKPTYKYDIYKQEFRYISSEGTTYIVYTKPIIDPKSSKLLVYPSIALGVGNNANARYFDIHCDNEDNFIKHELVSWKDEGNGTIGSSLSTNIYKQTSYNQGVWDHDSNTIFDNEAVHTTLAASSAKRERVTSYEILDGVVQKNSVYFNRGIIANIYKDRLAYLPYQLLDLTSKLSDFIYTSPTSAVLPTSVMGLGTVWDNSSATLVYTSIDNTYFFPGHISFTFQYGTTKIPIDVNGNAIPEPQKYSTIQTKKFIIPAIKISINNYDIVNTVIDIPDDSITALTPTVKDFTIDLNPYRMVNKRFDSVVITFTNSSDCYISLSNISIQKAEYTSQVETINTYERQYIRSVSGNFGSYSSKSFNMLGPDKILRADEDMENDTLQFPHRGAYPQIVKARDKIRTIIADKEYTDKQVIDITTNNIATIEQSVQRDLYIKIYNEEKSDIYSYNIVSYYPALKDFFNQIGFIFSVGGTPVTINSFKLPWVNTVPYQTYVDEVLPGGTTIWQPGGHKYVWTSNPTYERCYWFASPQVLIYDGEYKHINHPSAAGFQEGNISPISPGLSVDKFNPNADAIGQTFIN